MSDRENDSTQYPRHITVVGARNMMADFRFSGERTVVTG